MFEAKRTTLKNHLSCIRMLCLEHSTSCLKEKIITELKKHRKHFLFIYVALSVMELR